jgi:hypothetical protein
MHGAEKPPVWPGEHTGVSRWFKVRAVPVFRVIEES